ncbi:MAG: ATP-binding cassette domain-containing protein [Clostridium sp.]|jgi:ABC-type dipeptide/oligopeptide/nickel transport system ATPase subunit|nr:ATP-binding cassette domain-containing protein [Clostridium sp.]
MRLAAEEISFQYGRGRRRILDRVSIFVEAGERVGLTAPSGFGKTTLCKLLAGYERPTEGRIMLDDRPLEAYKGRLPVQMIWQHPEQSVNPRWRMRQVLKEGGEIPEGLIRRLGIREEWLDRFPSELSGGELQRFCIARAMGEGTRILLADEITTMLDMVTQSVVWNAVLEEAKRREIGILAVSHSEGLLERICTRRVTLHKAAPFQAG